MADRSEVDQHVWRRNGMLKCPKELVEVYMPQQLWACIGRLFGLYARVHKPINAHKQNLQYSAEPIRLPQTNLPQSERVLPYQRREGGGGGGGTFSP